MGQHGFSTVFLGYYCFLFLWLAASRATRARSKRWGEVSVDLVGDRDAAWRASGNEVTGAPKAKMGMETWRGHRECAMDSGAAPA
jgi:hypothetical protein